MNSMHVFTASLTGLFFASFLLALADRFISKKYANNIKGFLCDRSSCDYCGKTIPFYYNIPLAGYIISLGHCRSCKNRISLRYPLSEVYGLILSLFSLYRFGFNIQALVFFSTVAVCSTVVYADIKTMEIPDSLLCVLIVAGILFSLNGGFTKDSWLGFASAGGAFALFLVVFPGSFGTGDLKFAALLGFFTGFQFVLVMLETALITGSIFGALYAVTSGRGLRIKIPFAPFIAIGYITAILYGADILILYHNAFAP
ncbi:MAG: prepilin peptidase [Spirochaetes bacterium]|nr:prepilin peptidase [Spirochaetota bacterium]MBN2769993.1 prepilin peptidase [Spirochaetota bacterium]